MHEDPRRPETVQAIKALIDEDGACTFIDPMDFSYETVGSIKRDVLSEIVGDKLTDQQLPNQYRCDATMSFDLFKNGVPPENVVKEMIQVMIKDRFDKISTIKLYIRERPDDRQESSEIRLKCKVSGRLEY